MRFYRSRSALGDISLCIHESLRLIVRLLASDTLTSLARVFIKVALSLFASRHHYAEGIVKRERVDSVASFRALAQL